MKRETKRGRFLRDASGLWHYDHQRMGMVSDAIRDALEHRPKTEPCWFWFNDTPAAMFLEDDEESLHQRWVKWRDAYQRGGGLFLKELIGLT